MAAQDQEALSGRLRDRVTLLAPPAPEDRNTLGEPIGQSAAECALWANVRTLSGRELVYAQQIAAEATTTVEIRWRPGIDRYKSLDFGGRQLNIDAAVDEDNLRKRLVLYCREER